MLDAWWHNSEQRYCPQRAFSWMEKKDTYQINTNNNLQIMMPDIKETCQMLWKHITGEATLVWVCGRPPKGSNNWAEAWNDLLWTRRRWEYGKWRESMWVPESGNNMFKKAEWICLCSCYGFRTTCLLENCIDFCCQIAKYTRFVIICEAIFLSS